MTVPAIIDHPFRSVATMIVGAGEVALAIAAASGRLAYTVPPRDELSLLADAAGNGIWKWLMFALGVTCILSVARTKIAQSAASASAGVLGVWAFLNLLWGFYPVRPVSLGMPILGLTVAALAFVLARAWAVADLRAEE
jgi:hypothetical protein